MSKSGSRSRSPGRVLIAGGDSRDTSILTGLLERQGYDPVWAGNGEEAWTCYRYGRYLAIISEWDMPGINGLELLSRIRDSEDKGYTYFIILSDLADAESVERCMEAGADDFLPRPLDSGALLARLRVAERIALMQDDIAQKNLTLEQANQELEMKNERMRRELRSAARVQQALLPSADFRAPGLEFGWRLRPCDELAGDLLNCMRLDEQHAAFYVLDVSGHGVSSALMSVQISRLMSPLLSESGLLKRRLSAPPWYEVVEPIDVVARLNELFQTTADQTQYFTMIYGVTHLASGRVRLVSAGHPGPVYVPADGASRVMPSHSHPVGFFPDAVFQQHELDFQAGDRIWLYSDGVIEVTDPADRAFGTEGLQERIGEQRDRPLRTAVDEVMNAVESWSRPGRPDDDCTLLAIEGMAR